MLGSAAGCLDNNLQLVGNSQRTFQSTKAQVRSNRQRPHCGGKKIACAQKRARTAMRSIPIPIKVSPMTGSGSARKGHVRSLGSTPGHRVNCKLPTRTFWSRNSENLTDQRSSDFESLRSTSFWASPSSFPSPEGFPTVQASSSKRGALQARALSCKQVCGLTKESGKFQQTLYFAHTFEVYQY